MNLNENIIRIKSIMGLINENSDSEENEGAGAYDAPAFEMEPDHTTFKHEPQEQISPIGNLEKTKSCGIEKACEKEDREFQKTSSKELKIWDQEVRAEEKEMARKNAISNKNFLSLSFNRNSDPLDRDSRKLYQQQYQDFIKNNPNLLNNSDGFNSEQKYAIISKTLDFIKKVPDISYSSRLKKKFGLNPTSTLQDVIDVVNKMGGWTLYMDWFNSGGPEIK